MKGNSFPCVFENYNKMYATFYRNINTCFVFFSFWGVCVDKAILSRHRHDSMVLHLWPRQLDQCCTPEPQGYLDPQGYHKQVIKYQAPEAWFIIIVVDNSDSVVEMAKWTF